MKRRLGNKGVVYHQGDADHQNHSQEEWKQTNIVKIGSLLCLLAAIRIIFTAKIPSAWNSPTPMTSVSYIAPSNVTNEFLATFERVIGSAELSLFGKWDSDAYVPLILENNRILCRRSHMDVISKARIRAYIEMLNVGLEQGDDFRMGYESIGLPIMLIESDGNGCYTHTLKDHMSFPRLTWSFPSPKYGQGWCKAIGMPCYESWNAFRNKHAHRDTWFVDHTWDGVFKNDEKKYPWLSKIDKAVWRGSTTYPLNYHEGYVAFHGMASSPFDDIPRAKLVQKSMERPDLIDAGFTSFVQDWESRKEELSRQTIVTNRIRFVDQMKFRAIIDIDGNNWSSRFGKLLCTNSVVIKVDPDYIEYFYSDLNPMVHYVPASLENLTEVAAYVLDKNNRDEMKAIVESANSWCKTTNNNEQLPRDAISQLDKYEAALYDTYNMSWAGEWGNVRARIFSNIGDDLVDCSAS